MSLPTPPDPATYRPRPLIYVAGPYSADPVRGLRVALETARHLHESADVACVVPHLSLVADLVTPEPPEHWYRLDWDVLARCDAVWRIDAPSLGADAEESLAVRLGIPVFHETGDPWAALRDWIADVWRPGRQP